MTTMNTNTKATTSTVKTTGITLNDGTTISKNEFKRRTFDAYCHYVNFIEQTETVQTTIKYLKPLFESFGITFDQHSFASVTMYLTNYGTMQGEKVRKVKSITTFRKFLTEGYAEMMTKRVVSNAGKAPAPVKAKTTKAKEPTKAELKKEIAALKAQIAQKDQQIEKVEG